MLRSIFSKSPRQSWELALVMVTVLWGWSFVAIHDALSTMSATTFNAFRFLCAALAMLPILLSQRPSFSRQDCLGGVTAGLALFLASFFQTSGLNFTSASNVSFITGLAVVFTPLFAYIFLSTPPEKRQLFGALCACAGLALLTLRGFEIHKGDFLALLCAICFALHIVILSKASKVANALHLTFIQVSVVAFLSLFQAVTFNEFSLPTSASTITTIVIMGVLGTAGAFYVQTKAQLASSPNRIALIIVLEPVFGGLFGYFLGGDRLGFVNFIGAGLIVVSILMAELDFKKSV